MEIIYDVGSDKLPIIFEWKIEGVELRKEKGKQIEIYSWNEEGYRWYRKKIIGI